MTDADTEARALCRCVNCSDVTLWPCDRRASIAAALRARETQTVEALRKIEHATDDPDVDAPDPIDAFNKAWTVICGVHQIAADALAPLPPGGEKTPTISAAGLTYPTCPTCCSHDHSPPAAAPREDA